MPEANGIEIIESPYDHDTFLSAVRGFEEQPEGGLRCDRCIELRLRLTAKYASASGYDAFATTLTTGPRKPAARINPIGESLSAQFGIDFIACDLKKRDGYKQSIALSRQYNIYRQDYCGCELGRFIA